MATYTKNVLSASNNGRGILINNSTGTDGTTLHTVPTGTTGHDEVWIYAYNRAGADRNITILFGGASDTDKIESILPSGDGMYTLIPGLPLNNGLIIRAYATVTESVNIFGFVNRITI